MRTVGGDMTYAAAIMVSRWLPGSCRSGSEGPAVIGSS
jgi:hypothetical protein